MDTKTESLILSTHDHLGDSLILTAVIRDLKLSHPRININIDTRYREVFNGSPYICRDLKHGKKIKVVYRYSQRSGHVNCIEGFISNLEDQTGLKIKRTEPKVDVHLSDEELKNISPGRIALINAGNQICSTIKNWGHDNYQRLVNDLVIRGFQVVQIGGKESRDNHQPLQNCENLIGQTSIRDLIILVMNSQLIVTPPSALSHLATINKDCRVVNIIGGRESEYLTKYKNSIQMVNKPHCAVCMKFSSDPKGFKPCINLHQGIPLCMAKIGPQDIMHEIDAIF